VCAHTHPLPFSYLFNLYPAHLPPSPPCTPPRTPINRGHRHTQSLINLDHTARSTKLGLLTPPRSSHQRQHSHYHFPSAPPSFLTTPTRCKPTLAMSILYAPSTSTSPAPSVRDARRSRSPVVYSPRPTSPTMPRRNSIQQQQQELIPRPPSRSERLLRDTLMRDELERCNAVLPPLPPPPPPPPHHAYSHSRRGSYSCENGYEDDTDDEPWAQGSFLFRTTPLMGSTGPGVGLVRTKSTGHVPPRSPRPHLQRPPPTHKRQTSPTPSRHNNLPRNARSNSNSLPTTVPRSTSSSRSNSHSNSHSRCHSHSVSSLPAPHEAVLRSRLEKVLSVMGREELDSGVGVKSRREEKRRSGDSNIVRDREEWLWNSRDVSNPLFLCSYI
jgi:hypothetical protein